MADKPYRTTADGEWHYLPRGRVTHFRRRYSTVLAVVAPCGTAPSWFAPSPQWRGGTGNQDEYERAEQLPKCRRCLARVQISDNDYQLRPIETLTPSGALL